MKTPGLRGILLILMAIFVCLAPAHAERGDAGSNAADFLRLNAGAAAAAQGEAYAGRSGGIEVLPYNPAGLRHAESNEIMLQHNSYLLDMSANYLGGVMKISPRLRLAGSLQYFDQGTFTRRTITSPNGIGSFDANALTGSLALAGALTGRLSVGIAVKGFSEEIDDATRSGIAADAGLHYRTRGRLGTFEAGLVGRNLGPSVIFDLAHESLPSEFAAGMSFSVLNDRLRLSSEVAFPRRQEIDYRAGVEIRPVNAIALRAGYNSRNDLGSGLSLGAGFQYQNFMLDYAYVGFRNAGDAHRVALTTKFGGEEK